MDPSTRDSLRERRCVSWSRKKLLRDFSKSIFWSQNLYFEEDISRNGGSVINPFGAADAHERSIIERWDACGERPWAFGQYALRSMINDLRTGGALSVEILLLRGLKRTGYHTLSNTTLMFFTHGSSLCLMLCTESSKVNLWWWNHGRIVRAGSTYF